MKTRGAWLESETGLVGSQKRCPFGCVASVSEVGDGRERKERMECSKVLFSTS